MKCPRCGLINPDGAIRCDCGYDFKTGEVKNSFLRSSGISMGHGRHESEVPVEIIKWNWGAFLLTWIWGLANKVYISLLALIPFVGIVMAFVLGFKGNEWAWKNKWWDSIEHFNRVQRQWTIAGILVYILGFFTGLLVGLLG